MSWTVERARVASLTRSRTPDDPDLIAARQNLTCERLSLAIRQALTAPPALTDCQRADLAALILGGEAA